MTSTSSFHKHHQRYQGACQQQNTAFVESWTSIAFVSITAINDTNERINGSFTGRVGVCVTSSFGNAIFVKRLGVAAFKVNLSASIKTSWARVNCTCWLALVPGLWITTTIALQSQCWKKTKIQIKCVWLQVFSGFSNIFVCVLIQRIYTMRFFYKLLGFCLFLFSQIHVAVESHFLNSRKLKHAWLTRCCRKRLGIVYHVRL